MKVNMTITYVTRSTVIPTFSELEPYRMETEETKLRLVVMFSYLVNGELITRTFTIWKGAPTKVVEWLAKYNKRKFERKLFRYLARMEW